MATHFHGKEAIDHVIEKRAEGILSLTESHGAEIPGHISAGADSARETAVVFSILWLLLNFIDVSSSQTALILVSFAAGWLVWKGGRSAFLGWARLERLHRVAEQEKYEIEHNRAQEREELGALYKAKGFSGKLLEDVLDVLMADEERLLRVMLEEELGLTLQAYEHPLKQALGAILGVAISSAFLGMAWAFFPNYGMAIASLGIITGAALVSSLYEKNRTVSAIVWNLGIASLGIGCTYFVFPLLKTFF